MATKKKPTKPAASRSRVKQLRIPGTYDKPSKVVEDKGQQYAETLYERMAMQAREAELRGELAELMTKEGITKFKVDDTYEIELKTPDGPPKAKIKCKKIGEDDGEGDGDGVFE